MNSIVKIDGKDFNLTQEKVNDLISPFIPIADEYSEKIPDIENIKKEFLEKGATLEIESKAKTLGKALQKLRKKTGDTKDEEKRVYRQAGDVIQKSHNLLLSVIEQAEKEIEEISKFRENQEKERLEKLQFEREEKMKPYMQETADLIALCNMDEEKFNGFLLLRKTQYEEKIALEKKIEADRIEAERLQKEKEIEEAKKQARLEAEEKAKIEAELEKQRVEKEKQQLEQKRLQDLENVRIEKEKEIKRIKQEQLQKELAEKKKKEDEEKARLEAEEKEKKEKELAEKRQEFINYRDSIDFDHYEDKDGFRIFYKKVGEFKIN